MSGDLSPEDLELLKAYRADVARDRERRWRAEVAKVDRSARLDEAARILIKQGTHPDVAHDHARALQEAGR